MHKKLLSEDIFWKCKNLMVCQIHFLMVREKRTLFRRNGRLLGRVARFFLKNIPNDHKIYQMAIIYIYHMAIIISNGRKIDQTIIKCTPAFTIQRPSKIYPNLDFWFENKPSGNLAPGEI
jgi:hypothetical protein